jgi:hypothetical protein
MHLQYRLHPTQLIPGYRYNADTIALAATALTRRRRPVVVVLVWRQKIERTTQ